MDVHDPRHPQHGLHTFLGYAIFAAALLWLALALAGCADNPDAPPPAELGLLQPIPVVNNTAGGSAS